MTFSRDELVARLVRAGELEVSGESPEEARDYFASNFVTVQVLTPVLSGSPEVVYRHW